MWLLERLEPWLRPAIQLRARLSRGATLGVRGIVRDAQGRVCLVRHTYTPGWYMPGGGVERGEAAETALARELAEEAGIVLTSRPRLLSVHDNAAFFPGDHVLVYLANDWSAAAPAQRGEIAACEWFAPDALPLATTPATRARLREAFEGQAPDLRW